MTTGYILQLHIHIASEWFTTSPWQKGFPDFDFLCMRTITCTNNSIDEKNVPSLFVVIVIKKGMNLEHKIVDEFGITNTRQNVNETLSH